VIEMSSNKDTIWRSLIVRLLFLLRRWIFSVPTPAVLSSTISAR
jgi:hypothetical protein